MTSTFETLKNKAATAEMLNYEPASATQTAYLATLADELGIKSDYFSEKTLTKKLASSHINYFLKYKEEIKKSVRHQAEESDAKEKELDLYNLKMSILSIIEIEDYDNNVEEALRAEIESVKIYAKKETEAVMGSDFEVTFENVLELIS